MITIKHCGLCDIDSGGHWQANRCEIHRGLFLVADFLKTDLDKQIEKWARKARKLGTPAIGYEIVREHFAPVFSKGKIVEGLKKHFYVVKILGEAPRIEGFEFLARLEHTEHGNIIAKAPGVYDAVISEHFRNAEPYCSHCRKLRRRNDTFLVREIATGAVQQIGRNCLADYIRSGDVEAALHLWKLIDLIEKMDEKSQDEEGWGGGGGHYDLQTDRFVAAAWRAYHVHGWASSKTDNSTRSMASFAAGPEPKGFGRSGDEERAHWREMQPRAEDWALAKESIDWAKSLTPKSDYEHNLYVVAHSPVVRGRNEGILASLVKVYTETTKREVERREYAKKGAASSHFGEAGHKYVRELAVESARSVESQWGMSRLYLLVDSEGNKFKWFASGGDEVPAEPGTEREDVFQRPGTDPNEPWLLFRRLRVGDRGVFAFTVKQHDSYQGITQTQISRATMLLVPPERAYKWLAPSGEIFGSKKALVQAGFAPADKPRSPRAGAKKIMQARAESVAALDPFEQFDLYDERS